MIRAPATIEASARCGSKGQSGRLRAQPRPVGNGPGALGRPPPAHEITVVLAIRPCTSASPDVSVASYEASPSNSVCRLLGAVPQVARSILSRLACGRSSTDVLRESIQLRESGATIAVWSSLEISTTSGSSVPARSKCWRARARRPASSRSLARRRPCSIGASSSCFRPAPHRRSHLAVSSSATFSLGLLGLLKLVLERLLPVDEPG